MAARRLRGGGGYPNELFVQPVDENFNCAICNDVAREPMLCNHDHLFCADCICTWLQYKSTCPIDRRELTTGRYLFLFFCLNFFNLPSLSDHRHAVLQPSSCKSD